MIEPHGNVVPFRPRKATSSHPRTLIERVYAAGSLAVGADERPIKTAALMMQALGLLTIQEVMADGTLRVLTRQEARAAIERPWRLAKPAFSGLPGIADADGYFVR